MCLAYRIATIAFLCRLLPSSTSPTPHRLPNQRLDLFYPVHSRFSPSGLHPKTIAVRFNSALGDLLFYISTQNDQSKATNLPESPSKETKASSGWQVGENNMLIKSLARTTSPWESAHTPKQVEVHGGDYPLANSLRFPLLQIRIQFVQMNWDDRRFEPATLTPISGEVQSATSVPDLPRPALAVHNLMEQAYAYDQLGIHTKNLLADPRSTLVVQIPGWSEFSNARVTIFGDVYPLPEDQQAHKQYITKHQQAPSQQWGNFYYFRMQKISSDIYFIGGFGTVAWVNVNEYECLQPDDIAVDGSERNLKEGKQNSRLLGKGRSRKKLPSPKTPVVDSEKQIISKDDKNQGKVSRLMINDIDAGLGRFGELQI
ncbi:hypothetical protein L1887_37634 [Cichorium endivia]|nr:hypothetical protein L1887_37634 [Cichorium endivia]